MFYYCFTPAAKNIIFHCHPFDGALGLLRGYIGKTNDIFNCRRKYIAIIIEKTGLYNGFVKYYYKTTEE